MRKQFGELTESRAAHPAACSAPEGGDSAPTDTPRVYLYCDWSGKRKLSVGLEAKLI